MDSVRCDLKLEGRYYKQKLDDVYHDDHEKDFDKDDYRLYEEQRGKRWEVDYASTLRISQSLTMGADGTISAG